MTVLLTGFEAYGGRTENPSGQIARSLDGEKVAGEAVEGRCLAVELRSIGPAIRAAIEEAEPSLVLCLGLWPGESMLRLERIAVNEADFDIPDNAGYVAREPLDPDGPAAYASTLPLHAIRDALLAAGIPCHLSGTAGRFLCNAVMYHALATCAGRLPTVPAGFIHVPYLPHQAAALLAARHAANGPEGPGLASMGFELMQAGTRLAIECGLSSLTRRGATS